MNLHRHPGLRSRPLRRALVAAFPLALAANALAQTASPPTPTEPEPRKIEPVVVTATPVARSADQLSQPATVITRSELQGLNAVNLGDTLSALPGVTSSGFAPGAGRPIIRGQDGPRVQMLENGLGIADVSVLSPDHRVATETLNATQVEVLRGPATLLYGSGAIGGLVNVVNRRIPLTVPAALGGELQLRAASGTGERSGALEVNGGADRFAWHVDALKARTDDYAFPGLSVKNDPASFSGRLPNSDTDNLEYGLGASFVADRWLVGASVQDERSTYGVPAEEAFLDMKQRRADLLARYTGSGWLESATFRLARTNYEHSEIELPTREVAVTFKTDATEGRAEFKHAPLAGWRGTMVLQAQRRDFSALSPTGDVEIVEPVKTQADALALVEERDFGAFALDLGLRTEREEHRPTLASTSNRARSFNLMSVSAGGLWRFAPGFNAGLTLSSNERAPTPSELYTNGPHEATATFEVGDASLRKERSRAIDLTLRKTDGPVRGSVSLFQQRFSNYVFGQFIDANGDGVADRVDEAGTVDPAGEFVFLQYVQTSARFRGAEFELLADTPLAGLTARIFGDTVRATLADGSPVPRIAPQRLGVGLRYAAGPVKLGGNLTRVSAQNRVSLLETPTEGYTRLDLDASWRIRAMGVDTELFALVRNATNEAYRLHTSILKDEAPQPGRSVVLGLRSRF